MEKKKLIVIHCSATPPDMNIGADEIHRWHVKDRGWSDIGYHHVIRRNGVLEKGRSLTRSGAHAKGHNKDSVGICLVGGVDENQNPSANFSPGQMITLRTLVDTLGDIYPGIAISGHRDLPGVSKACPSFHVAHWLETGEVIG